MVSSIAFLNWFEGSVVINEETGQPLRLYHGTGKDFLEFEDRATFFTSDPDQASSYALASVHCKGENSPFVLPVYLSIKNPYRMAWQPPRPKGWWNRRRTALMARGFDGVILPDGVFIAFSPYQIKSAISNSGQFDSTMTEITA